jgi:hypothetical protein
MKRTKIFLISMNVFFAILLIALFVGCGTTVTVVWDEPAEPEPTQKTKVKRTPQDQETQQESDKQVVKAEDGGAETQPAPTEEAAVVVQEPEEEPIGEQPAEEKPAQETKKEPVHIQGLIVLEKNHYYVTDTKNNNRYKLVGLQPDDKARLHELQGSVVSLDLRVVSTQSAKASIAQLVSIGKVIVAAGVVTGETPPKKQEKVAQQPEKADKPKESQKQTDQIATEGKTAAQPTPVNVQGVVSLEKNHYYITDKKQNVRYKLVGLQKDQKNQLNKLRGSTVRFDLKVLSSESAKAHNAQLITIGKVIAEAEAAPKDKQADKKQDKKESLKAEEDIEEDEKEAKAEKKGKGKKG